MTRHESLFNEYVAALRTSMIAAQAWWTEVIAAETRLVGNDTVARERLDERWPFGAASHPYVIAVFREYFLKCESLNAVIEADDKTGRATKITRISYSAEELDELALRPAVRGTTRA